MNKYRSVVFFLLITFFTNTSWSQIIVDDTGKKHITIGSTKDEVIEVLGTPSKINAFLNCWYYGYEYIGFDGYDRIKDYTDAKTLRILLVPQSQKTKTKDASKNSSLYFTNASNINTTILSKQAASESSTNISASGYGEISEKTGRPKTVHVNGYYRKDGTYVKPHYRSAPKRK